MPVFVHRGRVDTAAPSDLLVASLAPLLVIEQQHHGMALVGVGAGQPVGRVGANAVEDRVALGAFADLAGEPLQACARSVEAVGQPVGVAIGLLSGCQRAVAENETRALQAVLAPRRD